MFLCFGFICTYRVCFQVFGLLASFGFVLACFSVKNAVFLGFDFEDVIFANSHGHICNQ